MKTMAWASIVIALLAADVAYTVISGTSKYYGHEAIAGFFIIAFGGFCICALVSS